MLNRQWCEWETEHFSLFTDLREKDAAQISKDLLAFHYASNVLLSTGTARDTKIEIIIFRNAREFRRELKQNRFIGLMQPSFQEHQLLLSTNLRDHNYTEIPFHEYAHHQIKIRVERPVSRWLEEGLAQYLATTVIDKQLVTIGQIQRRRMLNSLASVKDLPWSEILAWNLSHEKTAELSAKYDVALGLIHFLVHGTQATGLEPTERIVQLLEGVNGGTMAIDQFLDLVGLEQNELFDALYDHFSKAKTLLTYKFPLPEKQVSFQDCLNEIDRHLLIARSIVRFNLERAYEILQRVERQYPGDFRVLSLLSEVFRQEPQTALKYAEAAYRTKPDSAVTNLALANVLVQLCADNQSDGCNAHLDEAETHYRKAMTYDHSHVDAAFGLGSVFLYRGRAGEALNFLRVAQKQIPWSARIYLQLGEAYRQLGNLSKAKTNLEIAVEWDENEDRKNMAVALLAQIKQQLKE